MNHELEPNEKHMELSFPRKRESPPDTWRDLAGRLAGISRRHDWIPAFAGMTDGGGTVNDLGKTPIVGDRRAGVDVKYDPAFDALQVELGKCLSVTRDSSASWEKVATLASDILSSRSKDLVVAGTLALALIHTKNTQGFLDGSTIVLDWIEHFWDDGFPEKSRARGRSRAISWWVERCAEALKTAKVTLTSDDAERLCIRFEKAQQSLRSALDDCPFLNPLVTATRVAAETPAPDTIETAPTTVSATASPLELKRALSVLTEKLKDTASMISLQDRTNPLAYRLRRLAFWAAINELPIATNGRTLLAPPDPKIAERLQQMLDGKKYDALLSAAEDESSRFIFWLDLQRFSAQALTAMDGRYSRAADAVRRETVCLLHRLPGLDALMFSDGTPFAHPDTVRWLLGQ